MNQAVLRQKMQSLAAFAETDPQDVARLERVLQELDDWQLFRINPLRFAAQHGFAPAAMTDLFVRGAKIGLFDFDWNMICPSCGSVEYSHNALHEIQQDRFHCTLCNADIDSELDKQVEVAFSLNPAVTTLAIDPYAGVEDYNRYCFTPDFRWPAAMESYMRQEAFRAFAVLEPDDEVRLTVEAQPGQLLRLITIEHHAGLEIHVGQEISNTPQIVDVDLLRGGFAPKAANLLAGQATIHVHSHLPARAGLTLLCIDRARIYALLTAESPTRRPFLTAQMLINNQVFRDLFRVQNLPYDLKLKVSNVTVLFTDLKGSTELYDATGDIVAYNLVQEHFELLKAVAHQHSGALIKTMGDAVMASFSNPLAGFMAGLGMMEEMATMLTRYRDYDIGLKVGLHAGPALAVNANETLDYFGQTVNVASRVQGLAQAGEVWLTAPIYEAQGVQDVILTRGYRVEKSMALLKGVRERTTVYRCVQ